MIVTKSMLVCDKCGEQLEIKPDSTSPFSVASTNSELREAGWIEVDREHHLCPGCAAAYNKKKDEMERELKALAGIKTIEFDL